MLEGARSLARCHRLPILSIVVAKFPAMELVACASPRNRFCKSARSRRETARKVVEVVEYYHGDGEWYRSSRPLIAVPRATVLSRVLVALLLLSSCTASPNNYRSKDTEWLSLKGESSFFFLTVELPRGLETGIIFDKPSNDSQCSRRREKWFLCIYSRCRAIETINLETAFYMLCLEA